MGGRAEVVGDWLIQLLWDMAKVTGHLLCGTERPYVYSEM